MEKSQRKWGLGQGVFQLEDLLSLVFLHFHFLPWASQPNFPRLAFGQN